MSYLSYNSIYLVKLVICIYYTVIRKPICLLVFFLLQIHNQCYLSFLTEEMGGGVVRIKTICIL